MFNILKILNDFKDGKIKALFYTPSIYKRARTFLFYEPTETIEIFGKSNWDNRKKDIDKLYKKSSAGFGLINYEFGYLLEERTLNFIDDNSAKPLLKFYFFDRHSFKIIPARKISFKGLTEKQFASPLISQFKLNTTKEEYINNIFKIKNYITAGDTYQVNYTVKGKFNLEVNMENLFLNLIFNQSSSYSTLINNGDEKIISFSPELFFSQNGRKIRTRPMKGTQRRLPDPVEDDKNKIELIESEKDRAENIMIVDLLRNDLGKISRQSTVQPADIFEIEKYESLYQMVTTVNAELKTPRLTKTLEALFPCGSITGAPKLRTMEIINELEIDNRGIYCGSIGLWQKRQSVFNVAIRTLIINEQTGNGEMGIGSGIVSDSNPESEYSEVLLKADFLNRPMPYFELFETMLLQNGEVFLFDYHLERLKKSADYFLFQFDESSCRSKLIKYISKFDTNKNYRLKLFLNKWGAIKFSAVEFKDSRPTKVKVVLSDKPVDRNSKFLYHKTTNRKVYSLLKIHDGTDFTDTILFNENDEITEGTFTNIFIKKGDVLITPPVSCGLLNGCFRRYLLDTNITAIESKFSINDILEADEVILINSLRKEIHVDEIFNSAGKLLKSFQTT